MWGKKKRVEEPVEVDEVFDDLYAELDDIVETADEPEAEVPVDFEARVAELEKMLRDAQEGARLARLAAKPEGLSPFKTPFEAKPAAVVERPRDLNRRITPVEVEPGESRIVSQFEDNEPEDKKVYPAVWNLGYRLEELAAAVAGILVDEDTGELAHEHDGYAAKEEFESLKAQVEEHLTNHPEGGETPDPESEFEFRWEHDSGNTTPPRGKGYWDSGENSFHLSKTDADLKSFFISTGKQDIVVKTGDAITNITEVLQVYDLGTGWVVSIKYTGDRPIFGEEILWGVEEEEPEGPHWEFSYTNKFVRNQDGARWDNGGDGVSAKGWLPKTDAEGNAFTTQNQYEVRVEDEDGNRSSWNNYRATSYAENGVEGFVLDFEAWGLLEGDVLYYEPSRKWVSGNRASDEVINQLVADVETLKTRLTRHGELK